MINSAFQQQGLALAFATSASLNTSQSRPILLTDIMGAAGGNVPQSMRIHNSGTATVWVNFTKVAGAVAVPLAGTTTVGTPAAATPLYVGLVEVFTVAIPWALINGVPGFFMQDISSVASQPYEVIFGEGI